MIQFAFYDTIPNITSWLQALGGVATFFTLIYLIITGRKTSTNVENLAIVAAASQEQVKILEKRFRLMVKPEILTNGGSYSASDNHVGISIENYGKKCFFDSIKLIEGDNVVFNTWSSPILLFKGKGISIQGTVYGKHPKDAEFKAKLFYHDRENYYYECVILWKGGSTKLLETIEL